MEIHYQRNVGFFFYSSPHSPSISERSVEFGWKIVLDVDLDWWLAILRQKKTWLTDEDLWNAAMGAKEHERTRSLQRYINMHHTFKVLLSPLFIFSCWVVCFGVWFFVSSSFFFVSPYASCTILFCLFSL